MEVDFYRDNPEKAPTVKNYLFTDFYAELMVGRRIQHNFKLYQVTGLLIPEKQTKQTKPGTNYLTAFVWQFPDNFLPAEPADE